MRRDDRGNVSDKRRFRGTGATFGGYLGIGFGFLVQLSAASETPDQFHRGQAILFVLVMMIAGCAVGWLLGPVIARLFGEA